MDLDPLLARAAATRQALLDALMAKDLAAANGLIAEIAGAPQALRIDIVDNSRVREAAPVWRIDAPSLSRMRFHPRTWANHPDLILARWIATLPMLLAALPTLAPGSCSLNLGDEGHVPGLAFCENRPGYLLIPDAIFLMTRGYADLVAAFAEDRPWQDRHPVAFWRGALTGRPGASGVRDLPRVRLCRLGASEPAKMDFGLTDLLEAPEEDRAALIAEGLTRPYVPIDRLDRYQLHIDIDGHSNSWPGLMAKLHSGGAVIKIASEQGFRQWYYDRLEPWVHYAPVRADMADLPEVVDRLMRDPALTRAIGRQGQALARSITVTEEIKRAIPTIEAAIQP